MDTRLSLLILWRIFLRRRANARNTTLHCTALHCTALHCTALHCTATLHCTALRCYTTLHYTALHCTALHYTTLHNICNTTQHKCWMKFDFHQTYCPTNMFDQQMLDSLAKASTKLDREKRRAYSAIQSHIVNYSRDLILVDKMAELDEVVENPIKQLIKSKAKRVWNCLQNLVELLWAHRIISLNPRVSCIFSSFILISY